MWGGRPFKFDGTAVFLVRAPKFGEQLMNTGVFFHFNKRDRRLAGPFQRGRDHDTPFGPLGRENAQIDWWRRTEDIDDVRERGAKDDSTRLGTFAD
jgi:hypothetical protein